MKNKINRWVSIPSIALWFLSYSIIMITLGASVFTYNQVYEARAERDMSEKRQEWIETNPEEIWVYNDILVDRDSTDEDGNFTVGDELRFRSFTTVDLSVIEPDIVLPIIYLDKFVCQGIYDKTYRDDGFLKDDKNGEEAWTLGGIGTTFEFSGKGCHLVACQTVTRYGEPKTQCTTSEYFDILPKEV